MHDFILSFFSSIIAYFTKEANPHHATMERVIHTLTEDKDADVRAFFAEPQAYDSDGEPINDISVSFKWHSYLFLKGFQILYLSFLIYRACQFESKPNG